MISVSSASQKNMTCDSVAILFCLFYNLNKTLHKFNCQGFRTLISLTKGRGKYSKADCLFSSVIVRNG